MKTISVGIIVVAALVLRAESCGQTKTALQRTQFVGTMPCGEAVRTFLGGEPCESVIWRLDLGVMERGAQGWSLTAAYGANSASSIGQVPDGLHLSGKLERSGTTYRLTSN